MLEEVLEEVFEEVSHSSKMFCVMLLRGGLLVIGVARAVVEACVVRAV